MKVICPKLISQGGDGRCVIDGCDMASDDDYNNGKCIIEIVDKNQLPLVSTPELVAELERRADCSNCAHVNETELCECIFMYRTNNFKVK